MDAYVHEWMRVCVCVCVDAQLVGHYAVCVTFTVGWCEVIKHVDCLCVRDY